MSLHGVVQLKVLTPSAHHACPQWTSTCPCSVQAGRYQRWRVLNTGAVDCSAEPPTMACFPGMRRTVRSLLGHTPVSLLHDVPWEDSQLRNKWLDGLCQCAIRHTLSAGYKALVDLVVLDPATLLPTNSCDLQLLAKDGVYLLEIPRR